MEQEIALFLWSLKDSLFFNIAGIISGKLYILLTSAPFIVYAIFKLKKKSIQFLIALAVSVSASDIICYRVLKPAINRDRPRVELNLVHRPASIAKKDYSMPSNHASNMFSFFIVYLFYLKRFRWMLLANSLIISTSRVVMVKHYPTDVLFGIATGIIIGLSSIYLVSFFNRQKINDRFKRV